MSSPTRASAHRRQLAHFTCGTVTKPEPSFPNFFYIDTDSNKCIFSPCNEREHHWLAVCLFVCPFVSCVLSVGGIRVCSLCVVMTGKICFHSLPLTVVMEAEATCSLAERSQSQGVHARERERIACPDLVHIPVKI